MVITAEGEAEAARLISEALKTGRSRPVPRGGGLCVCWGGGVGGAVDCDCGWAGCRGTGSPRRAVRRAFARRALLVRRRTAGLGLGRA